MSFNSHSEIFSAPESDKEGRVSLIGKTLLEIQEVLGEEGVPKFRAKQIWNWIYHRGVTSFEEMKNIPKELREILIKDYSLTRPKIITEQKSADGTIKWLLEMSDGQQVETVYIPEAKRGTLCVSSQVGCTLTCKFCHTGTQALVRNLGANEIIQQVLYAKDMLEEWPKEGEKTQNNNRELTNIVMMGMGEPLYNYDNVAKSIKIFTDVKAMGISKRRITLSTSGVVPQINQCGEELGVNLAISLHAANDILRSSIMPINKKYPLAELLEACRNYPNLSENRRITFEYVMLKDINDSDEDALQLAKLLSDIPCKINIIPFNSWEGSSFECSSNNRIRIFSDILKDAGYDAPVRKTRGQDILAACGQLKSASVKKSKKGES